MAFKSLDDIETVAEKRILVRVDINVPMADGQVTDTTRMERIKPTIDDLCERGGRVILLAHYGRPKGAVVPQMSLSLVRQALADVLGREVAFAENCIGDVAKEAIDQLAAGGVLLLENTRFHQAEEKNDPDFVKELASIGDLYVNDAFSAAHRAHASTEGIARLLPAYAGRTMQAELSALDNALGNPVRPVMAVVGGAKVSTKLDLLENLVAKVDHLVIGGGMANTFLAALGLGVGKSLCEHDLTDKAKQIVVAANEAGCKILLPSDVVIATEFAANADHQTVAVDAVPADQMILDAGEESIKAIGACIRASKTLVWNGPLGAFEIEPFDHATVIAAQHAAEATEQGVLVSVAGGGDTVSALNHAGVADKFSYVSTAGGAFLEWMEGKTLPGVAALES